MRTLRGGRIVSKDGCHLGVFKSRGGALSNQGEYEDTSEVNGGPESTESGRSSGMRKGGREDTGGKAGEQAPSSSGQVRDKGPPTRGAHKQRGRSLRHRAEQRKSDPGARTCCALSESTCRSSRPNTSLVIETR